MQRGLRGVRATYDVLVVGGGVLGAWTAAIAARRGATVALADQFEPAHTRGSSHGDGRIYRLAYQQEHYVDMMLHSLPLWRQLQDFAGEPLMATTGGINIASTREALADLQVASVSVLLGSSPISPYISLYLPISPLYLPYISYRACTRGAASRTS